MTRRINDFKFKQFEIRQQKSAMKVGTDGVLLGAWVNIDISTKILDIGTGTGLIALMVSQRFPKAQIDAIEIDEPSYQEASENIDNSPWSNNIDIHRISLQEFALNNANRYSTIISNPPFFSAGTQASAIARNKARHIDSLPHDDLLTCARQLITDDGIFSLILPVEEGDAFILKAMTQEFYLKRKNTFFSKAGKKAERLLLEFSLKKNTVTHEKLTHYDQEGNWTEDYKLLTKDFYLRL